MFPVTSRASVGAELFTPTRLVVEFTFRTFVSTVRSPETVNAESVPTEVMFVWAGVVKVPERSVALTVPVALMLPTTSSFSVGVALPTPTRLVTGSTTRVFVSTVRELVIVRSETEDKLIGPERLRVVTLIVSAEIVVVSMPPLRDAKPSTPRVPVNERSGPIGPVPEPPVILVTP